MKCIPARFAIYRGVHLEARTLEHRSAELQNGKVVLHHENAKGRIRPVANLWDGGCSCARMSLIVHRITICRPDRRACHGGESPWGISPMLSFSLAIKHAAEKNL